MALYRVQVVFQGRSNMPEDQFVNTWHFLSTSSKSAFADAITLELVSDFYTPIRTYMSGYIGTTGHKVKVYDLGDPTPRIPAVEDFELTTGNTGSNLPNEVAVCLSYHAAAPITARRRGRLFIGPLHTTAMQGAGTAEPRVNDTLRGLLASSAEAMLPSAASRDWVVHSPTAGASATVTGGWIDNAFDTQRRRGTDPTDKELWGGIA